MTKTLCAAHGAPLSECEQCWLSIPAFLRSGARNEAYSLEIAELRAKLAEAIKQRDAAFAMSRCECGPEECCENLLRLHSQLAEAQVGRESAERELERLRKFAAAYRRWAVALEGTAAEGAAFHDMVAAYDALAEREGE